MSSNRRRQRHSKYSSLDFCASDATPTTATRSQSQLFKRMTPAASADSTTLPRSKETQSKPSKTFKTQPLRGDLQDFRRTNDEIHSTIWLDPVTCVLLDTPPMQRLRSLKQLGTAEYVYMNVNHTRFEHSLGVASLAERLCRNIQHKQPQLGCTNKDVLCVKLAGLFHDVGHGPFSHVFEEFIREHLPAYLQAHPELEESYKDCDKLSDSQFSNHGHNDWTNWRHEAASLLMLDAALEYLGLAIDLDNLDAPLQQIGDGVEARSMRAFTNFSSAPILYANVIKDIDHGYSNEEEDILTSRDFVFIKEAINGKPIPEICKAVGFDGFVGRPSATHKEWLYDIVSNRHSGLDVDKIDYYARDQRRAFREAGEIDKVMIEDAFVAWGNCSDPASCTLCRQQNKPSKGMHLMLCYPEKMVSAVMEFFKKRADLHSRLYQHKTHCAVARMICDILCLADPYFRLSVPSVVGEAPDTVPVSRAMLSARSYVMLRDSVIDQIANTTSKELEPARRLISRLWSRKLYVFVGEKRICLKDPTESKLWSLSEREIVKQMLAVEELGNKNYCLAEDDLFVHKISIHCGLKHDNPLSKVRFVERNRVTELRLPLDKLPVAGVVDEARYDGSIPRCFMSIYIRFYCRDPDKAQVAKRVYQQWLKGGRNDTMNTVPDRHEESGSLPHCTQDSDDESIGEIDLEVPRGKTALTVIPVTPQKRPHDD